jgi:hypothetical protein
VAATSIYPTRRAWGGLSGYGAIAEYEFRQYGFRQIDNAHVGVYALRNLWTLATNTKRVDARRGSKAAFIG